MLVHTLKSTVLLALLLYLPLNSIIQLFWIESGSRSRPDLTLRVCPQTRCFCASDDVEHDIKEAGASSTALRPFAL